MSSMVVILSIDEIWLKGLNRHQYLNLLRKNVKSYLKKISSKKWDIKWEGPKLLIHEAESLTKQHLFLLSQIPGVSGVTKALSTATDFESVRDLIFQEHAEWLEGDRTFCVKVKRSNKSHPLQSPEMAQIIGGMILAQYPHLKVKLKGADKEFGVRTTESAFYVSVDFFKGVGGLPVGSSGRALCMLSGGFDSPVASFMMSRRGLEQGFVFFYAYPLVGPEVRDKILELANKLATFQSRSRLYIVHFGEIQKHIAKNCPPSYRTILFRKAMVECSCLLAQKIKAKALITGDSLSQVSSQTLENVTLMNDYSSLPILRPLIGFNKVDILNMSQQIGTHDISNRPHDDACSLFSPKHPVIFAKPDIVADFDAQTPMQSMYEYALDNMERIFL